MAEEVSYVIVTPHSIRKSRTGGILARLISRTGLDLVRSRMFAPSRELIEAYASQIVTAEEPRHRETQELIREYLMREMAPRDADGARRRVMFLLFRGEDAIAKLRQAVGHIVHVRTMGETIRDTFGDYVEDETGRLTYFEPAALTPPDEASAARGLRLWADFSDADGGLLEGVVPYPAEVTPERTLVLIKPDNFRFPNSRPGGVIDVFSQSGLSIVGFKVHRMSVAQAEEFYAPVLEVLQRIKRDPVGADARLLLEREFGLALGDEIQRQLGDMLGPIAGLNHWENIVKFMSGRRPGECPPDQRDDPGSETCVAIVYEGADAVRKIRRLLGPTDPSQAPPGSIRREFGQTIMINAAHASDSPENAAREMDIVQIRENNLKELIDLYYPHSNN